MLLKLGDVQRVWERINPLYLKILSWFKNLTPNSSKGTGTSSKLTSDRKDGNLTITHDNRKTRNLYNYGITITGNLSLKDNILIVLKNNIADNVSLFACANGLQNIVY